jgi:hypothetical protein
MTIILDVLSTYVPNSLSSAEELTATAEIDLMVLVVSTGVTLTVTV